MEDGARLMNHLTKFTHWTGLIVAPLIRMVPMNAKYKAKKDVSVRLPYEVFTLPESSIVTVIQRNGNKKVLVVFDEYTTDWVDASWFINNFEGIPI
jgi:hypothetical protein